MDSGQRLALSGLALSAAFLFIAPGGGVHQPLASVSVRPEDRWAVQYSISAHVLLLGKLKDVGSMTFESALQRNEGSLEKTLRIAGCSNLEQVKKNRDYSGEFNLHKIYPLPPDGSGDEQAGGESGDVESSSSGFLKINEKRGSERIAFFPDHAVAVRNDGTETKIEGSYGCILSPLEYLMEHEIKVGEVIEIPFILDGIPRIFRLEVVKFTLVPPFKTPAYEISMYAIEKTGGVDRAPKDVWRKKGNVQVWFCKDGRYRNRMLRMKIKFRWYLWLRFDLQKTITG